MNAQFLLPPGKWLLDAHTLLCVKVVTNKTDLGLAFSIHDGVIKQTARKSISQLQTEWTFLNLMNGIS